MLTPGALQATHPATLMGEQTKRTDSKSCHCWGCTAALHVNSVVTGLERKAERELQRVRLPFQGLSSLQWWPPCTP